MSKGIPPTPAYTFYPLDNYSFSSKAPKHEKDTTVAERLERMRQSYEKEGPRRTVEGVLLVEMRNHPHVLLLQLGHSFFKLPGGRLRPGEDEAEGLRRKLSNHLSPPNAPPFNWDIGECVARYWRPNFGIMFYPYLPPHITKPKESKKLFMIPLPENCSFTVPRNMKLIAVPLFELYDSVARYGPIISSLPVLLSRFLLVSAGQQKMLAPPAQHNGQQQQQQQQQHHHQQQQQHYQQQQQQHYQQDDDLQVDLGLE